MVDGILVSWKRFERACSLHTSGDFSGLVFPRVTEENILSFFSLCPEGMVSLLFLMVRSISVVDLLFWIWLLVCGLFIIFGLSFILRRGDVVSVVSAVVGESFVIFC